MGHNLYDPVTDRLHVAVSDLASISQGVPPSRRARWRPLLLVGYGVWGVLGCSGGDTTGPVSLTSTQLYWALRLNVHAVNLALSADSTVQLRVAPVNAAGDTVRGRGLGSVVYTFPDSSVSVSAAGLVTAHYITDSTDVIATMTDSTQSVTHADTVVIQVIATPPASPLATFSIQPAAGDSAIRAIGLSVWTSLATKAVLTCKLFFVVARTCHECSG